MGRSKKASSASNPYAERGLDRFSQLKAELTAKREEIAARIGAPLSEVRLTSASSPGVWIPVYPSSVVQSSASSSSSSSPRSGYTSPRASAFPFPPAITEDEEKSDKIDHEEPPSEAIPTLNSKDMRSTLGLSLSLLGLTGLLCGALYARGSGLFAQISAPLLVFLISFYGLQSKSQTSRLWIRQIFRSMRQFSRFGFEKHYSQGDKHVVQKELDQNPLSSSQPGMQPVSALHNSSDNSKPPLSLPSTASVSSTPARKAHVIPHRQEHPSPAAEESSAMIHKPQSLPSKFLLSKTGQDEARCKTEIAGGRLRGAVSAAASEKPKSTEIRSRSAKFSRTTRNAERQDRLYGLLLMLTVALAGLAFGMVPGILCTATSWFFLPIMKELIMSKDRGSGNAGAIKRKEHTTSKANTVDQFSSLHKLKQMQRR